MCLYEYDEERQRRWDREEGREEGREEKGMDIAKDVREGSLFERRNCRSLPAWNWER